MSRKGYQWKKVMSGKDVIAMLKKSVELAEKNSNQ